MKKETITVNISVVVEEAIGDASRLLARLKEIRDLMDGLPEGMAPTATQEVQEVTVDASQLDDLTRVGLRQLAKQLGIDPTGKTAKQLRESITEATPARAKSPRKAQTDEPKPSATKKQSPKMLNAKPKGVLRPKGKLGGGPKKRKPKEAD